jgi:hypothetical protein
MSTMTTPTDRLVDGDHIVQFYDHDDELVVAAFARLTAALERGEGVVAVATPEHLAALRREIQVAGMDDVAATQSGQLLLLDATATLDAICVDGNLDRTAFERVVGGALRQVAGTDRPVHALGGLVALLWTAGDVAGAIELERLWDDLAAELAFSLHCSYPADLSTDPDTAEAFARICDLHTHVIGAAPAAADAEVSERFVASAKALSGARRLVADTVNGWGCTDLLDDCLLVAGELAANAALHGEAAFTVSLSRLGDGVRIVVGDTNGAPPTLRVPDAGAPGGRGLQLVDGIASSWGYEATHTGKLVWAEVRPVTRTART